MLASEAAEGESGHEPVLLDAVVEWLLPALERDARPVLVDGTVGLAGHADAFLRRLPGLRLVGIDRDPTALEASRRRLEVYGERVRLVHGNHAELGEEVSRVGWSPVLGVLLDLGVSSPQLDRPERGFSFRLDGPLDMRMDPTRGQTAAELLRHASERELADLLWQYGEERHSRRIARHLVEVRRRRPIDTTRALREAVIAALPALARQGRDHPARRTFQALRIAVNDALGSLRAVLTAGLSVLTPGGRLAVISFHSLEDRIVKHTFRDSAQTGELAVLTKRPLVAGHRERSDNPRSRSAKMRFGQRGGVAPGGEGRLPQTSDE